MQRKGLWKAEAKTKSRIQPFQGYSGIRGKNNRKTTHWLLSGYFLFRVGTYQLVPEGLRNSTTVSSEGQEMHSSGV